MKRYTKFFKSLSKRATVTRIKASRFINKHPMMSFFSILGLVLVLIVISNLITKPQATFKPAAIQAKPVDVYRIGSAPTISVQAQINKSGIIQIVALTPGIVQTLNFAEGDTVYKGATLLSLSTNYQGGNTLSLSRQLAQQQYQNVQDTYQPQKDIITKQIEAAHKTDENSDKLRDIANQSITDTQAIVQLNEQILSSIDANLTTLQQNPDANSALILSTQQLKSQFLGALAQARVTLRANQYQAAGENPPGLLSDIQKDITLKQLDLQSKQLDLQKELSRIQLQIAQVNEATMYPAAPFGAVVQKVFVNPGDSVNPATPLMILAQSNEDGPTTAVAYVPQSLAAQISKLEPSTVHIGDIVLHVTPSFISTEAVSGSLYGVYYPIPEEQNAHITNKGFITIDIPIGYYDTAASIPFVPLDAVYQTSDKAYVFVNNHGKAQSRTITLDQVYGRFVEVQSGLSKGDSVIVSRNVIDGDPISIK